MGRGIFIHTVEIKYRFETNYMVIYKINVYNCEKVEVKIHESIY